MITLMGRSINRKEFACSYICVNSFDQKISFGKIITHFVCMAQRLASSKTLTKKILTGFLQSHQCSWLELQIRVFNPEWLLTPILQNFIFSNKSSEFFWYLIISHRATVPALYLCGFLNSLGINLFSGYLHSNWMSRTFPYHFTAYT